VALILDAEEAATVIEDEVVALAVSPGLGDAEAERAGFVEESGLGALSAGFGVGFVATKAGGGLAFRMLTVHSGSPETRKARLWPRLELLSYSYSIADSEGNCATF
jgi:hypothetical protein